MAAPVEQAVQPAVLTPQAVTDSAQAAARYRAAAEAVLIPIGALVVSLALFGIFVAFAGVNPFDVYGWMADGAFGSWFSIQNTLTRASPLIMTALCTALPAQLGLMIIGGEGALVMGGLVSTVVGVALAGSAPLVVQIAMALTGMIVGGLWIALAGGLRHYRGVNETIASLLLVYVAIAILNHVVEGPFRDPKSLNKPSSPSIGDANMLGTIPGTEIHWGLAMGVVACIIAYILINHTVFGFSARVAGGNVRAARMVGLPVGKLILITCFLGGAAAGLAGMVEVSAVQERANASLIAGYGYTGILVSFLARHNPLAIVPVAVLLGGIGASGGMLQRHLGLPDAATVVLQGILFIVILASDVAYGRINLFARKKAA
jgi:simple sugar transport system permease protein